MYNVIIVHTHLKCKGIANYNKNSLQTDSSMSLVGERTYLEINCYTCIQDGFSAPVRDCFDISRP